MVTRVFRISKYIPLRERYTRMLLYKFQKLAKHCMIFGRSISNRIHVGTNSQVRTAEAFSWSQWCLHLSQLVAVFLSVVGVGVSRSWDLFVVGVVWMAFHNDPHFLKYSTMTIPLYLPVPLLWSMLFTYVKSRSSLEPFWTESHSCHLRTMLLVFHTYVWFLERGVNAK